MIDNNNPLRNSAARKRLRLVEQIDDSVRQVQLSTIAANTKSTSKSKPHSDWEIVEKIMPVTNCGAQNEILALHANEGGTFLRIKSIKHKGGEYLKKIATFPVYPVALLEHYDTNSSDPDLYVELEAVPKKKRRVTISLSALGALAKDKSAQEIIGRLGVSCTRDLGYGLHEVASAAWKARILEEREATSKTGWDSEFKDHIRPGSRDYVGRLPRTTESAGTFEAWRDAIVDLVEDSPVFTTILSFAVGSYCRGLPGAATDHSSILHIFSPDSSVGKSFAQQCCASMQSKMGKDGNIFIDFSSTQISTQDMLAASNHGFLCPDELHSMLANEARPVQRLMELTNNGGRQKLSSKNGDHVVAEAKVWNATIISSANISIEAICQGHAQAEPLRARVIEIDAKSTPIFGFTKYDRIDKAREILLENYGHAYPLIIQYISENMDKVTGLIREFKEIATEIAGDEMMGKLSRRVQGCAFAYAGAHILSKILDAPISSDYIVQLFRKEAISEEEYAEQELETAVDQLLGVIRACMGTFTISGYLALDEGDTMDEEQDGGFLLMAEAKQKDRAIAHNNKVTQRTTSNGMIAQKSIMNEALDFSECQIFITTFGKESLAHRHCDVNELAHKARAQGWLIQNGGGNDKGTVLMQKKGLGRCYAFDLAKAKRLLEERERLAGKLSGKCLNDDIWPDIPF